MLKQQILDLSNQGYSNYQIADILKCSRSTVTYHLKPGAKLANLNRGRRNRAKSHPYVIKLYYFKENRKLKPKTLIQTTKWKIIMSRKIVDFKRSHDNTATNSDITFEQVMNKFGETPKCYLTGQPIDIYDTKSYEFDHKIPRSRGGDNSLDNMEIATKQANRAKGDMTYDEFMLLCKQVVNYNHTDISLE